LPQTSLADLITCPKPTGFREGQKERSKVRAEATRKRAGKERRERKTVGKKAWESTSQIFHCK